MTTPVPLKLSQPIQAHGRTIEELAFRHPTGRDLMAHGFPFDMTGGERSWNTKAIGGLIQDLAGIPMPSVWEMAPADFYAAGVLLAGFMMGLPMAASQASSTATSKPPPGGAISAT